MTDIVERLRYRGGHAIDDEDSVIMREAADEIERLRAALDDMTAQKNHLLKQVMKRLP